MNIFIPLCIYSVAARHKGLLRLVIIRHVPILTSSNNEWNG